jgi:hypothetical protein
MADIEGREAAWLSEKTLIHFGQMKMQLTTASSCR